MNIATWQFCLLILLSFCLGIGTHVIITRGSCELSSITNEIRSNWFWFVFVIVLVYVISNFDECIDLHFTDDFNGKNLIFLLLIVLAILPMFESIKANGICIKLYNQSKDIKNSEDSYEKAIKDAEKKASHVKVKEERDDEA